MKGKTTDDLTQHFMKIIQKTIPKNNIPENSSLTVEKVALDGNTSTFSDYRFGSSVHVAIRVLLFATPHLAQAPQRETYWQASNPYAATATHQTFQQDARNSMYIQKLFGRFVSDFFARFSAAFNGRNLGPDLNL
eukprot:923017-Amphidinium_carterae.3